jgi:uncharacterized membrane protein YhhN
MSDSNNDLALLFNKTVAAEGDPNFAAGVAQRLQRFERRKQGARWIGLAAFCAVAIVAEPWLSAAAAAFATPIAIFTVMLLSAVWVPVQLWGSRSGK